jgi:ABC-2 type transport system permease protein
VTDVVTVLQKELRELVGSWRSPRGAVLQAAIVIVLCGVILPLMDRSIWAVASAAAMLYLVFPSVLAGSVAADAFAGERERKTLETLLATPLSDGAIFLGKALTAVLFGVLTAAVTLGAALASVSLETGAWFWPGAELVLGALAGAVGAAAIAAALGIAISSRALVARSAQQLTMMASMGLVGVTVAVLHWLHQPLTWATLIKVAGVLWIAGLAALGASLLRFRRERFFERR